MQSECLAWAALWLAQCLYVLQYAETVMERSCTLFKRWEGARSMRLCTSYAHLQNDVSLKQIQICCVQQNSAVIIGLGDYFQGGQKTAHLIQSNN